MTALAFALVAAGLLIWPAPSRARARWQALVRGNPGNPRVAGGPRYLRAVRADPDPAALRAVRALRAELAAGARPPQALAAAGTAEPALAAVLLPAARAAAGGEDVAAVLAAENALTGVAAAWRLAEVAGVPAVAALDGVAADLARRVEQRQAVQAALAGPRATALLLAGLPVLGLFLAAGIGAHPVQFLAGTAGGRGIAAVGLLLDVTGLWWTSRLARSAART